MAIFNITNSKNTTPVFRVSNVEITIDTVEIKISEISIT